MNRRLLPLAFALPVLPRAMAAQEPTAAGRDGLTLMSAEAEQRRAQLLAHMAFALASSQLAEQAAADPALRRFALLEAEEQTTLANIRRQLGLPVPTPELMDAAGRDALRDLQAARDAAFDAGYLRAQQQAHQAMLRLNGAIAASPADREEEVVCRLAIPLVRAHLALLATILPAPG
jgi:putative membrane protein